MAKQKSYTNQDSLADIDRLMEMLAGMGTENISSVGGMAKRILCDKKFVPLPGPQTEAYFSKADLLFYGGQGGGGKSFLLPGLAIEEHVASLIIRREYKGLEAIIRDTVKIWGSERTLKRSPPPQLKLDGDRVIDFDAAHTIGIEQAKQGHPHDFLGVDEAVQFAESQVQFYRGWVRSAIVGQRSRTVLASNPPVQSQGDWIVGWFRPWLDITYPRPAEPGELRWFITDPDGKDKEVDGPETVQFDGDEFIPQSRTFIPATLYDNPYLVRTGYKAQQDAMPEPLRSAVRDGNFAAARRDQDRQVIPTAWIIEAQQRWTELPPIGVPMCVISADIACGGDDETVLIWRHDLWFSKPLAVPGRQTPLGSDVAALIVKHRRDACLVTIDMGGGYGGAPMEHLRANGVEVAPYKGARESRLRTADRQFSFANYRSMALWRMREALDPSQPAGSSVAIPDDRLLLSDLTAPTWQLTSRGIQVEPKEDVCERLGRSTDRGDAAIMALVCGPTYVTNSAEWSNNMTRMNRNPRVLFSRDQRRAP